MRATTALPGRRHPALNIATKVHDTGKNTDFPGGSGRHKSA